MDSGCKLIDVSNTDYVYKYIPMYRLLEMIENKRNTFVKVSSWSKGENGDNFEGLFRRLYFQPQNEGGLIPVSRCCEQLYGQSWTLLKESSKMWCAYSQIDTSLNLVAIKVKTKLHKLMSMMDESITTPYGNIIINNCLIGKVNYYRQSEIDEWFKSLGIITINQVQEYNLQYALMKLKGFEFENEVRCLSWGKDEDNITINFPIEPDLFEEFIIDPRLSSQDFNKVRDRLLKSGIDSHFIHQSDC